MGIQKQEFYEGAALHQIIRSSGAASIAYDAPLFVVDRRVQIHLKYSTGIRSPWAFTFTPEEQGLLHQRSIDLPLVIGLICGADGIATLHFGQYKSIATLRHSALRVSCFRRHRQHFEISGPDGSVPGKVPPSDWQRILA